MSDVQSAEVKEPVKKVRAKKEKDPNAPTRPRLPKFPDEHVITVLKEGAKARGAHERFIRYYTGMTIKQYVDKMQEDFNRSPGQTHPDLRWDEAHKFIHVGPTVIDVPKPVEQTPAAA